MCLRFADDPMCYIHLPPIFAIHYMDNWGPLPVYLVDVVPLVLYKPIQSKRLCSFGLQKTLWKGGNLKHKNLFHSFSSSFLLISVEPDIGCGVECAASSGPSVSTFTRFCHNMEQDKLVREKRNSVQSLSS